MMKQWIETTLGEYLLILTDYHANGSYELLKKNVELVDTPNYAVMIRTTNFENDDFWVNLKYINQNAYEFLKKSKVLPGDILMNKIANAGSVYLMPDLGRPVSLAMNLFLLRVNRNKVNQRYVYEYLKFNEAYIKQFAIGTATVTITKKAVRNLKVMLPPIDIQNKIAVLLSAYDDLIENNKRRIALLENMAEEIYREWFVRFRFPGYQTTEFEKGIPRGWKLVPYTEAVNINPIETIDKEEEKPYVGMEALSTNSMYFEYTEKRKGNSGAKFRNGDTLFPRITPCLENGKRGFVSILKDGEVGVGSTEFIVMREKLLTPEYIYLLCCFEPFRTHAEISMVGASGRQRVAQNCFTFFLVPVPSVEILQKFTDTVRPMFESIRILSRMNSYLEKTRDSLLPRLISGKLSVENLDIQFPPSMQQDAS